MDPSKDWFDLFRVLFELVSAFGGVGLSFGLPTVLIPFTRTRMPATDKYDVQDNFSLSGAMRPLSKIVITIVMFVLFRAFISD